MKYLLAFNMDITWSNGHHKVCVFSHSVVSSSLCPHGLYSQPGFSAHGIFQVRIIG